MITIKQKFEWDSGHRVLKHEGKCATPHGHRYTALVEVNASQLDAVDRVIDFSVVKREVGEWIDRAWDHTTLVNSEDGDYLTFLTNEFHNGKRRPFVFQNREPTAETIASFLLQKANYLLADFGVQVVSVEVFETPNCSAKATWTP